MYENLIQRTKFLHFDKNSYVIYEIEKKDN